MPRPGRVVGRQAPSSYRRKAPSSAGPWGELWELWELACSRERRRRTKPRRSEVNLADSIIQPSCHLCDGQQLRLGGLRGGGVLMLLKVRTWTHTPTPPDGGCPGSLTFYAGDDSLVVAPRVVEYGNVQLESSRCPRWGWGGDSSFHHSSFIYLLFPVCYLKVTGCIKLQPHKLD